MYKQIEENIKYLENKIDNYSVFVGGRDLEGNLTGHREIKPEHSHIVYELDQQLKKWQSIKQELDKIIDKYESKKVIRTNHEGKKIDLTHLVRVDIYELLEDLRS